MSEAAACWVRLRVAVACVEFMERHHGTPPCCRRLGCLDRRCRDVHCGYSRLLFRDKGAESEISLTKKQSVAMSVAAASIVYVLLRILLG